MALRDLVVTLGVLGVLPVCLLRPWVGLLAWSVLSFMNPHRLTWGFAAAQPFAMMVALATLVGFVLTKDRKPFIWNRESVLLLALWGWFTITTHFAVYPQSAGEKWVQVTKILVMALLGIGLLQEHRRLRFLLLTIALSIGFFGVKGGIFVLATGGQWHVQGPEDSFIASNNDLALALNMCLPMFVYLAHEETRRWRRIGLRVAFALSVVAIPFTYSRGGMIGLAVVLGMLFIKARMRLLLIPLILAGVLLLVWFAPTRWTQRMETLQNVDQDASANLRLMSWQVARAIAADRPVVGGGFRVLHDRRTYDKYLPEYPLTAYGHDAHSIYFNLLGDHGVVGLGLFLVLVVFTFSTLRRLGRLDKQRPDLAWLSNYAHMIQASLIAYLVTGTFLSVAYFDLSYQLFVVVAIMRGLASNALKARARAPEPITAAVGRPFLRLPLPVRLS